MHAAQSATTAVVRQIQLRKGVANTLRRELIYTGQASEEAAVVLLSIEVDDQHPVQFRRREPHSHRLLLSA